MDSFLSNVYVLAAKPSFFELSQAENIGLGLHAALQHLLLVLRDRLATHHPAACRWPMVQEMLVTGLIEAWFLATRSAFFGENFWGLLLELAPVVPIHRPDVAPDSSRERESTADPGEVGSSGTSSTTSLREKIRAALVGAHDRVSERVLERLESLRDAVCRQVHTDERSRWLFEAATSARLGGGPSRHTHSAFDAIEMERARQQFALSTRARAVLVFLQVALPILEARWKGTVDRWAREEADNFRSIRATTLARIQQVARGYLPEMFGTTASSKTSDSSMRTTEEEDAASEVDIIPLSLRTLARYTAVKLFWTYFTLRRIVELGFRFSYLFQQSDAWSLTLWLLRLQFVRKQFSAAEQGKMNNMKRGSDRDHEKTPGPDAEREPVDPTTTAAGRNTQGAALAGALLKRLMQYAFWGSIYGLQFYQWFGSRATELQPYDRKSFVPPEPRPPSALKIPIYQDARACSLCKKVRRNPAQSISGYLFCYRCLARYVEKEKRCPATGWPMEVKEVRQIRLE